MSGAAGSSDFAARLEAAVDSGGVEAGDAVVREQNAVTMAMQLHEELLRERAAHELTRRSLARAYDLIAKMRAVLGIRCTSPSREHSGEVAP